MPTPKHLAKHIYRWLHPKKGETLRYAENIKPVDAIKIELRRRRKAGLTVHKPGEVGFELMMLFAKKKKPKDIGFKGSPTGIQSQ